MFDLYLESPNTGDFSSEINVDLETDLEVVPLFPRQNYSSFFQPRSQPRERVSFLFELRHFLSDRTLNGKMSSVAGASRFSFSLHEPKKKKTPVHVSFQVFFRTTHAKMSTLSRSFRFSCLSEAEHD